ncbi:site-specific integrase [Aerococcaceae bacterium NML191219]|nr:site-specific integrase [Aerococcaceae bacterium NML191219]
MARFVKRGKTWQYEISYKRDDGTFDKFRRGGFRTKKEAESAALEMELEINRGYNPRKQEMLFSTYFKNWMELYKKPSVSPVTYLKYLTTHSIIETYMPFESISTISREKYQSFLNEYAMTHAKGTVKRLHTHIRACFRNALDDRIILTDPTAKAVISGNVDPKPSSEKYIDYAHLKQLMQFTPTHSSHYIILIAAYTGARFGEILGLNWTDIDEINKTLTINKTWQYKLNPPTYGPTKNHEERTIVISDKLIDMLNSLPKENEKIISTPITSTAVNKSLKRVLKQLGISPLITLHGLRHSHASALLYQGINILSVSERLGHKDVSVTQDTYSHIVKELRMKDKQQLIEFLS